MKLLRLQLGKPFRSLAAGFEVEFLREREYDRCFDFHPYCLAGLNGSGKSNLLEALAAIFYHIECTYLNYRPEGFEAEDETSPNAVGFSAKRCVPDAFELEYLFSIPLLAPIAEQPRFGLHRVAHIQITKIVGERPMIIWANRSDFETGAKPQLARDEVKRFLPRYVLGYSSGHNETLSLPFFKMRFIYFDEYRDKLIQQVDYPNRPEGRLIYLDDQFSQIILLCHFLFPSHAVTQVFKDKVKLEGFRCFRLIIRRHHRFSLPNQPSQKSSTPAASPVPPSIELTSNLSGIIDKLTRCATAYYEDHSPYDNEDAFDLFLDYLVNDETRKAFRVHFGESVAGSAELSRAASAINLFHALQTLLTLNYYEVDEQTKTELYQSKSLYVNETIPTPASHERIARFKESELVKSGVKETIYLKNLSDGEHQLLHTIGLCLLFRHEPALFLLDEPETHLNPDWRASYISTLREALKPSESDDGPKDEENQIPKIMREVLLTSHSPFIISDCQQENVLVFEKDKNGNVTQHRPSFQTFGASANAITMKVFGQSETIGGYAMKSINELRRRLDDGEDEGKLIKEAGKELGDSVEKILFVNQALNKKEGK